MTLRLTVDGERWRRHLLATATAHPGIVPVCKGNGYGFTIGRLARRVQWLHEHAEQTGTPVDMLAVGTYRELAEVAPRYDGDLLVQPLGAAGEPAEGEAVAVALGDRHQPRVARGHRAQVVAPARAVDVEHQAHRRVTPAVSGRARRPCRAGG